MKRNLPGVIILLVVAGVVAFVTFKRTQKQQAPQQAGPVIAIVPRAATDAFWESVRAGAEKAVEQTAYEIYWREPAGPNDVSGQMRIVEEFVERKVSGIVLAPIGPAVAAAVSKASDANIPCVAVDSRDETYNSRCSIGPDEYIAGLIAARRLGKLLDGKGRIVVVRYMPETAPTTRCELGFMDTMKNESPNIQVVKEIYGMESSGSALAAVRDFLIRNPDVEGLFACNEPTSTGSLKAIQSQGRQGKIRFVACGTDKLLVDGLKDGTVDVLVCRNPYKMGYEAVKTAIDAIEGREIQKRIDIAVTVITKENVDTAGIQAILNPGS
jgi:ribose transport system substrate-binding protein